MRDTHPTRPLTKNLLAALGILCLVVLTSHTARADEVTIAGSTSGTFTNASSTNTGSTLMGLTYINSTFNVTTSGGGASLNGSPASPTSGTNINNLGSFYLATPAPNALDVYDGSTFTLTITFTAPTGITGGQAQNFTATLVGHVINIPSLQSYSVNVDFDNTPQVFTYTNADGSTGTFTLTVDDVNGITPNFARAITGTITNASQTAAPTPEPATLLLFGTGLAGALGETRRRRARRSS